MNTEDVKLGSIPEKNYADYRYEVIFNAYKWDPQVEDCNTVARHAVLLSRDAAVKLANWAEALAWETVALEQAIAPASPLAKELGLPRKIRSLLEHAPVHDPGRHVRLMRFDFHPTPTGWAVSEVNSDVPGGLAEASLLPGLARQYFPGYSPGPSVGDRLVQAFTPLVGQGETVAFVHATSYSDDRQVMEYLLRRFELAGICTLPAAPDHIRWEKGGAHSIVEGREENVAGIVRFFPLEWLLNLPRKTGWPGYFSGAIPACNHPSAILTQSKRLPLIWDRLDADVPTWRGLLPETRESKDMGRDSGEWILKPAFGRVGEGISIREAVSAKELSKINKAARRDRRGWIAQRRFESRPLPGKDGREWHLCIGVFTVNGVCAGFYGRMSPWPRIDARAQDVPILVEEPQGDEQ